MVGVVVEVLCLQDLTLKVSGKYLNFWLSYKGSLIKLLTCGREEREKRERETSDFSSCPCCRLRLGWARAVQYLEKELLTGDRYVSCSHFDPCSEYLEREMSTCNRYVSCSHFDLCLELP